MIAFTDPSGNPGTGLTNFCDTSGTQTSCILAPTSITSPDGKTVTLDYEFWQSCILSHNPSVPNNCNYYPRLSRVSNSFGYSIAFSYASAAGSNTTGAAPPASFKQRTRADFYNSAAGSTALASATYDYSTGALETTDTGGRKWLTNASSTALTVRRPGATSDTTTYTLSGGQVGSVTNEGVTTSYSRSVSGTTATMTVTDAMSHATTIVSDTTTGRPTSVTDPLSRVSSYPYDSNGRLTRATAPEGNYTAYTYDSRGNATLT